MNLMILYRTRILSVITLLIFSFLNACKKNSVFQKKEKPEVTFGANDVRLTANTIHLFKDTVYILATNLSRDSGQTLEIDPGTTIKVNDRLSITINSGATIEAKGNSNDPIVFTSSAFTGGVGSLVGGSVGQHFWYGIRIYGNAFTNLNSGSGTLSHVRIEFAGGNQNNLGLEDLLPCLLLKNVTKETTIDNLQVSYSFETPSFE